MLVQRLILKNWRNFRNVDVRLRNITYLIGANASGKSNLLDVFRFLRDICKPQGGGLQKAVADRGGIPKLRCLHARRDPEVKLEVHLAISEDDDEPLWRYILGFGPDGKGAQRIVVTQEQVWKLGSSTPLLTRPGSDDKADPARLTQTHLEQIQTNGDFREIAVFFSEVLYLHVVPQLLKFGDQIGGQRLENDPFGQGLLEQVARVSEKVRVSRLRRIEEALKHAVPQFGQFRFVRDEVTGRPHLEVRYQHHRPHAGWQKEDQWSDGTLRLFGLLWSFLDSNSILLLEEPELSLNSEIVKQIPLILQRLQRDGKRRRQVVLTTHSEALLDNSGIDARAVLRLLPGPEGSQVNLPDEQERVALEAGLSVAEVMLSKIRPEEAKQLRLF
jgi:predicted ATPase